MRIDYEAEVVLMATGDLDDVQQYVVDVSLREDELAAELRMATMQLVEHGMLAPPEEAQLLAFLVRLTSATTVVEVGTFTGYSALVMALALPENGRVITCDISTDWAAIGQKIWARAGVEDRIQLEIRPAAQTLDALLADGAAGTVDFAFIDANKDEYPGYYERCLELLRPGGMLVLDNVLWSGRVADPEHNDLETTTLRALNSALRDDPRIELSMLPVFDGVTLVRKRTDV